MMKQQNIVFIVLDQLRADVLSFYGGEHCITPHMDRLAESSAIFDKAYTTSSVCSPARASLMTGLFPHKHGITGNEGKLFRGTLEDDPELLSRRLESLSYDRWYVGKWALGDEQSLPEKVGLPGQQFPRGSGPVPEFEEYKKQNQLKSDFASGPHLLARHQYGTLKRDEKADLSHYFTDSALDFLNRREDKQENPFFLWVNYKGPHAPYFVSEEDYKLYEDMELPPWPNFADDGTDKPKIHQLKIPPEGKEADWSFWESAVKHYMAYITSIDRQVGRIMNKLEEQGRLQDTMIILTADHGESIGAHKLQDKGHFMYQETYKVPFLMKGPDVQAQRIQSLVSLVDIYPTILDIAGDDNPEEGRHGLSIMKLLNGSIEPWREVLLAQFHGLGFPYTQRMLVDQTYKYIWNAGDLEELYNLDEDPYEMENLAVDSAHQELLLSQRNALYAEMERLRDPVRRFFKNQIENDKMNNHV